MPKNVGGNLYVHKDSADTLPHQCIKPVRLAVKHIPKKYDWNLIKVDRDGQHVTFSLYRDFDTAPHPELIRWCRVDIQTGECRVGNDSATNPAILHRKETFVSKSHPLYRRFAALTAQEERAGLYAKEYLNRIGKKLFWEALLASKGLEIVGHELRIISRGVERRK